jgi:pyruvate carboxylase
MALFMVANGLTGRDLLENGRELAYPESIVEFFEGRLGQPPGGFPSDLQKRILRGRRPLTERPGSTLPLADFEATRAELKGRYGWAEVSDRDVVSHLLYPKVLAEYHEHRRKFSDVGVLPTPVFFHGLAPQQETSVDIEPGKMLIVKYLTTGDPHPDGTRMVFFELNGQPREVLLTDRSLAGTAVAARRKADPANPKHVSSPMPGMVCSVAIAPAATVTRGQKLFTLEAMKMETTIYADHAGVVAEVCVVAGSQVEGGDLLMTYAA